MASDTFTLIPSMSTSSPNTVTVVSGPSHFSDFAGTDKKIKFDIPVKSSSASVSGFYIRVYEYDDVLPAGKLAINGSPNPAGGHYGAGNSPEVQLGTRIRYQTPRFENQPISTDYEIKSFEYIPTSTAKYASVVIGNSSSGIIEAPAFGTSTVNIGDRQKGRLRAASIINCEANERSIQQAIAKALTSEFHASYKTTNAPYGSPGASARIASELGMIEMSMLTQKSFYNLQWSPVTS